MNLIQTQRSAYREPGDVSLLGAPLDEALCPVVVAPVLLMEVGKEEDIVPGVVVYLSVQDEVLPISGKFGLVNMAHIAERGHVVI